MRRRRLAAGIAGRMRWARPFCVTIDGDTMETDVVTVRHRDSMEQEKVKVSELVAYLYQVKGRVEAAPGLIGAGAQS